MMKLPKTNNCRNNVANCLHACLRLVWLLLAMQVAGLQSAYANDAAVGMVLDMQGQAQAELAGKTLKLNLLSYLQADSKLVLAENSRISISLYANKQLIQVHGPAQFIVAKDGLKMLQGSAPVVKNMAEKILNASQQTNIVAGAVRLRQLPPAILLVTPEHQAQLQAGQLVFNWAQAESVEVEFKLWDSQEHLIFNTSVMGREFRLPADLNLQAGTVYTWQIAYQSPRDGKQQKAQATFQLLSAKEAADLLELQPKPDSLIEEWVLYAGLLQTKRLYPEARAAWQFIARQRPDLVKP